MEYEPQEENRTGGFIERMKESPRTVSAIIIVVIVIAAIYAFSGNNQNQVATENATPAASKQAEASATPETATKDGKTAGGATVAVTPVAPVDKNKLMDQSKALPAEKKTDSAYVEVAVKGDSLTTLSRKAATRYLASNDVGYAVTNEHRIYIEDYVRKHMEKHPVAIGSQQTVPFELIKQAVESAHQLNDKQLHNLTKYTHVLNT